MPLIVFLLYCLTCLVAILLGAAGMFLLCLGLMTYIHLIPQLWDVDEEQ